MKLQSILLVSIGDAAGLAAPLMDILVSMKSIGFQTAHEDACTSQQETECVRILGRAVAHHQPNLLLICFKMASCLFVGKVFEMARKNRLSAAIILASDPADPQEWRALLKLGPDDFLTSPFRPVDVLPRLWRLFRMPNNDDPLVLHLKEKLGLKQFIGASSAFLTEIQKLPAVARSDATALISGETGTGKELFARAIHFLSPRSPKPFNPLNCGAVPMDLVENELFGHDAGAFTGASNCSTGLIRQTDGGSLFLDEVDSLPLLAQVKLLRFLQEKEFRPLGSERSYRADVRVIAASNGNLEQAVEQGRFRRDLYYRLNVIRLVLPPLRERKEDIPVLARHFIAKHSARAEGHSSELTPGAVQKLMLYDWPGNVRELENVIERSVVLCPQPVLRAEDIELPIPVSVELGESFHTLKIKLIARFERGYIQELLLQHNGNITKAARAAGKHRRAFWEMMRKYQLTVPRLSPIPTNSARTFLS